MKTNKHRLVKNLTPYLLIAPIIILTLSLLAYPILYNLGISFYDWDLRQKVIPFVGLDNYIAIFKSNYFFKVLLNTVIWTVAGVFLQMVIGLAAALFIDSLKTFKTFLQSIMLMPSIVPGVVVALIFAWMLQSDLGIINFLLGKMGIIKDNVLWLGDPKYALISVVLINTWKACRFWFLMLIAALQSLPKDQVESAKIDGANYLSILKNVIIPHLAPTMAATGVLTTIWTLNYFDLIWVTTKGGPINATSTLPVYTYRLGFEFFQFGHSAAMAVISFLIICVLSIPYLRSTMKSVIEGGN